MRVTPQGRQRWTTLKSGDSKIERSIQGRNVDRQSIAADFPEAFSNLRVGSRVSELPRIHTPVHSDSKLRRQADKVENT